MRERIVHFTQTEIDGGKDKGKKRPSSAWSFFPPITYAICGKLINFLHLLASDKVLENKAEWAYHFRNNQDNLVNLW